MTESQLYKDIVKSGLKVSTLANMLGTSNQLFKWQLENNKSSKTQLQNTAKALREKALELKRIAKNLNIKASEIISLAERAEKL